MRSFLDYVEALVLEPAINMGGNIDELLDDMQKRIFEANAEELVRQGRGTEVFDTPAWQRQAQRMEEMFPPAVSEAQLRGEEPLVAEQIDDLDENMPDFEGFVPQDGDDLPV